MPWLSPHSQRIAHDRPNPRMKQLPYIALVAAAVILAHPSTMAEAAHLGRPTAYTTQANDTLSVAENHSLTLRWLIQPRSQSLLRIEGTSPMHDWQVESRMMEGYIELGTDALTAVSRAPMERIPLKAKLQIPVRSLKSVDTGL